MTLPRPLTQSEIASLRQDAISTSGQMKALMKEHGQLRTRTVAGRTPVAPHSYSGNQTWDEKMAQTHVIKCWPQYFGPIRRNEKKFDVRRDDRGYQKGDTVHLREWAPYGGGGSFTGNDEFRKIKYILTGGQFGIEPGYVVLGF